MLSQGFRVQGLGFSVSHRVGHRGAQTALARDMHLARDIHGLGIKDIRKMGTCFFLIILGPRPEKPRALRPILCLFIPEPL